jgi:hypothetical protein
LCCGLIGVPRLVPAPKKAGAAKQNAVVVIVVGRYARLVVIAGLRLLSFLCDYVENWPFLAIIDRHGYTLLPLKKRFCAILFCLKLCNPFL